MCEKLKQLRFRCANTYKCNISKIYPRGGMLKTKVNILSTDSDCHAVTKIQGSELVTRSTWSDFALHSLHKMFPFLSTTCTSLCMPCMRKYCSNGRFSNGTFFSSDLFDCVAVALHHHSCDQKISFPCALSVPCPFRVGARFLLLLPFKGWHAHACQCQENFSTRQTVCACDL